MSRLPEGGEDRQRVRLLDVLKGVCIVFIITTHFSWEDGERRAMLFPYWVDMAVPLFMLVSGYVCAASMEKRGVASMEDAYRPSYTADRVLRYLVPYTMAFLLETVAFVARGQPHRLGETLISFIDGGAGPGSYYVPLMLQFIFVFPLIYFPIRRNPRHGLLCAFWFNAAYEILQRSYGVPGGVYRLLLFRYTLLIAFGCFLYVCRDPVRPLWLTVSLVVGAAYIYLVSYTGYQMRVMLYFRVTSFVAALYIIPIFYVLVRRWGHIGCPPLEFLGRASFNIFLTQMVYYCFASDRVGALIGSRPLHLLANLVICLSAGTVFYLVEGKLTAALRKSLLPSIEKREGKKGP